MLASVFKVRCGVSSTTTGTTSNSGLSWNSNASLFSAFAAKSEALLFVPSAMSKHLLDNLFQLLAEGSTILERKVGKQIAGEILLLQFL